MERATDFFWDGSTQFFGMCFEAAFVCYNGKTLEKLSETRHPHRGISAMSTIADSNIIALVPNEHNDIQLWDRNNNNFFYEFGVDSEIVAVRLRPDVLLAVCRKKVIIYNLFDMTQLYSLQTCDNRTGVLGMAASWGNEGFAIPGTEPGVVAFYNWLNPSDPYAEIQAFDKPLKAINISRSGKLVAACCNSSSEVRIFDISSRKLIVSLRLVKGERVAQVMIDKWDRQVIVLSESMFLNVYLIVPIPAKGLIDPAARMRLSDKRKAWVFWGERLGHINVISDGAMFYRVKYDRVNRTLKAAEGVQLDTTSIQTVKS